MTIPYKVVVTEGFFMGKLMNRNNSNDEFNITIHITFEQVQSKQMTQKKKINDITCQKERASAVSRRAFLRDCLLNASTRIVFKMDFIHFNSFLTYQMIYSEIRTSQ